MINGETGETYPAEIFVGCILLPETAPHGQSGRFTLVAVDVYRFSPVNLPKVVPDRVVFDLVKWNVTV
jgi:hypothetical protein